MRSVSLCLIVIGGDMAVIAAVTPKGRAILVVRIAVAPGRVRVFATMIATEAKSQWMQVDARTRPE